MMIKRRDFLLLATTFVSGCGSTEQIANRPSGGERVVNAGPASNYAAEGVYAAFRSQGFFIVRRDGKLFALSAICTHKKCPLKSQPDHSFYCPCHGSTFDPEGHVTLGPAERDLPVCATAVDERGQLLVTVR